MYITAKLSTRGLENIHIDESQDCFYSCPSFVADSLSPKISEIHRLDLTTNEFLISTADPNQLFPSFLALGHGHELPVFGTSRGLFILLFEELGNSEGIEPILQQIDDDLTIANVISRLQIKSFSNIDVSRELEFAALHFSDISVSDFHWTSILFVKLFHIHHYNLTGKLHL
jgi:hypothetical protein